MISILIVFVDNCFLLILQSVIVQQNNNLAGETTETSHDTAKHRTNEEGIIDYETIIGRV